MSKILITRKIPGEALKKLDGHEVTMWEFDRVMSAPEIIEQGKEAEAIITLLSDRWTGEMMDEFPNLKIISNYAVGFDNVDVEAATKRGIVVTNTPSDEVNQAVAEFTWGLILSLSKRLSEGNKYAKDGLYWGWQPELLLGHNLSGKTLGIIGLGRIGSMVAKHSQSFGMKVLYFDEKPNEEKAKEVGAERRELDQLLAESDFISLHAPLTETTKHLINKERLEKVKQGAVLINTARGPMADEQALAEALKAGKLAGAALDVHEKEPQMNPELMQMENVILTPHIASATVEVREKMTEQAVDAILKVLNGEKPETLVNQEVWPVKK